MAGPCEKHNFNLSRLSMILEHEVVMPVIDRHLDVPQVVLTLSSAGTSTSSGKVQCTATVQAQVPRNSITLQPLPRGGLPPCVHRCSSSGELSVVKQRLSISHFWAMAFDPKVLFRLLSGWTSWILVLAKSSGLVKIWRFALMTPICRH
jgi:hypothetical protein